MKHAASTFLAHYYLCGAVNGLASFPLFNRRSPITDHRTMSVYQGCAEEGNVGDALLECIANSLEASNQKNDSGVTSLFLILGAALIFFMQAGFAMLCAGSVRLKNVQNTMLKNLLDACGAALSFFAVGYAFAFGGQDQTDETTFIGDQNFFMSGVENRAYWFYEFAFAATSTTIVAGTLAERCQMGSYFCYSVWLTAFVYPVVAHAIWSNNGFLSAFNIDPLWGTGMIDFAGSGVVHVTGGATALFATMVLGPRKGRFYDNRGNPLEKPTPFPGHSVALQVRLARYYIRLYYTCRMYFVTTNEHILVKQMLGTFILWFGWYGFNPFSALNLDSDVNRGAVASLCAVTTTLAAATGCVTALFTKLFIMERKTGEANFELLMAMNGALSGLVAITSGCAVVQPWAAVVIGLIAGWMYLVGSHLLIRLRLDDAVDAIPVHFVNGIWGVTATGLLADPSLLLQAYGRDNHAGWFYGLSDFTLMGTQLVGVLFIFGWVLFLMLPFFIVLNYFGKFRADSLEEMVGLDISYHGINNSLDLDGGAGQFDYVEAFRKRQGLRNRTRKMSNSEEEKAMEQVGGKDEKNRRQSGGLRAMEVVPEDEVSASANTKSSVFKIHEGEEEMHTA
jgi:Amt family ammonium transporter